MRFSPRASALLLFLSLLPAVTMVAHWSWPGSVDPGPLGTHSTVESHTADAAADQPGACQPERPCADASVHGFSAISWVGSLSGMSHTKDSMAVGAPGWADHLLSQSGVAPEPFPPRVAVS